MKNIEITLSGGPDDGRKLTTPSSGARALMRQEGFYAPSKEDETVWTWTPDDAATWADLGVEVPDEPSI